VQSVGAVESEYERFGLGDTEDRGDGAAGFVDEPVALDRFVVSAATGRGADVALPAIDGIVDFDRLRPTGRRVVEIDPPSISNGSDSE
jgi:hypothetical protein